MALAPLGILVRERGGENMLRRCQKTINETKEPDIIILNEGLIKEIGKIIEEDKDLTDEEVYLKYADEPY